MLGIVIDFGWDNSWAGYRRRRAGQPVAPGPGFAEALEQFVADDLDDPDDDRKVSDEHPA